MIDHAHGPCPRMSYRPRLKGAKRCLKCRPRRVNGEASENGRGELVPRQGYPRILISLVPTVQASIKLRRESVLYLAHGRGGRTSSHAPRPPRPSAASNRMTEKVSTEQ